MATITDKGELTGYVRYGYWLNQLHAKFYRRIHALFGIAQIVLGGVLAVYGKQIQEPFDALIPLALTCLIGFDQLFKLAKKAETHRIAATQYNDLDLAIDKLDLEAGKAQLVSLQNRWPDGFAAIEEIALRIVDIQHGGDGGQSLSLKARVFDLVV